MLSQLLVLRTRLLEQVSRLSWLGPLLARLTLGLVFIGTGWGKLHNLDNVTQFFAELHIPAPHFNAVLAATTEFVGGLCMIAGLLTRLAALPLAFTMLIAIVTARRGDVDGVVALAGLVELMYLVGFVWIALAGPGPLSLDRLLARRLEARASAGGRAPRAMARAAGEPRPAVQG